MRGAKGVGELSTTDVSCNTHGRDARVTVAPPSPRFTAHDIPIARSRPVAYPFGMILITGATGTVGSNLVEQLVADGQSVRALVRDPGKAANALPPEAELFRGDLLDAESLEEALAGIDAMFLL